LPQAVPIGLRPRSMALVEQTTSDPGSFEKVTTTMRLPTALLRIFGGESTTSRSDKPSSTLRLPQAVPKGLGPRSTTPESETLTLPPPLEAIFGPQSATPES